MKTKPNTMQTPRKLLKSIALASAVLCLATSAQAASIPHDYPFVPGGVPLGGTFQLVFVTPTGIAATSTDIAVYNAHVQSAATSAGLGRLTWKAIGSTATVNANVNAPVSADVYLTRTAVVPMVATAANFYTGSHLVGINYNPNGNAHVEVPESPHQYDTAPTWAVWTGSNESGTADSRELGDSSVETCYGYVTNTNKYWARWEHDNARTAQTKLLPLYGLSPALTTVDETANSTGVTADWHTPTTWSTAAVPTWVTKVIVDPHAVTITSATAESYRLTLSNSGSVSVSGQTLDIASTGTGALNTTGGTLALDASSTLNIAAANITTSFAGLTVASGTILNVTSELTVDANKDLSGATINTPKLTLAGAILTKSDGLTIGSGKLISGNGTVAGGTVTVAGGGKVSPGTDTTINTITANGLTLDSGSLLTMNAASTSSNDQITVSGSGGLTINGGAVTFLDGAGTAPQTALGAYNLIGYTGAISGTGVSALTVANPVAGLRYAFSAGGGFVTLTISQGPLWSGVGSGSWSDPAKWSGVTPLATETLVYSAPGASGSSDNDLLGASFKSIQFNSGVNAFTLTGNSVTLTGDPSSNVVLNSSTNIQTVNMPITLTGPANLNAASGAIVIDSSSTITNAGFDLNVKGAQPVTLNGTITGGGGVIRSTDAGKLNINSATALGTGTFTINGGTIDNTSSGGAVTLSTVTPQTWNDDFTFTGTQDLNLGTGAVTITKNGDYRLYVSGGASKTLTIGGVITMAGANSRLQKRNDGTLVISSAGSNLQRLQVTNGGTLRLDNSVAGAPSMAVVSERVRVNDDNTILDINNFALTTPGMDIDRGRIIVRGNSVINNTGGNRITESGDSNSKSFRFKDNAIINGGTGNLETHWTQAAQSVYITFENNAQGSFNEVRLGPHAEYSDSSGHNTVLEIKDNASVTTTNDFTVMEYANDRNRSQFYRGNMQVYQHGGTVTIGANLSIAERDQRDNLGSAGHQAAGSYNLHGGSVMNLKGRILGGAVATLLGKAFVNLHGGQINYTGAGAQSDWINLTVTAGTAGNNSHENLRLWQNTTIDTDQDLTINQAILAPTGDGISAIATTGLTGTVYTNDCPPWVLIEDTTGSGASAVPTINAAGNITGFTITNPGNNYSATPTVRLIRGGGANGGYITTVPGANISFADNATTYTGGLTKTGSGNLILTAANTYAGDTVVEEGTLTLSPTVAGGYLADGADVKLSAGTILALNTGTTDTIRSLYIDDVLQASGVWGAIGSGAPNTSALITGSGFLNVTIGASGYGTWATANVGGDLPHVDTNNDGVLNGVAYFMNQTGIITLPSVNGTNTVTWPNGGNIPSSNYGPGSGERYVVQTSSDLQTWNDVDTLDANLNKQAASVSYTITDPAPFFVRLRIIIP